MANRRYTANCSPSFTTAAATALVSWLLLSRVDAFLVNNPRSHSLARVGSTIAAGTKAKAIATTQLFTKKKKTLGLLTFDLDDSLYPIAPVLEEANKAFARAMEGFGFLGIQPSDIVETSRQIREEDPKKFVMMTHTEIRKLAIRREMEKVILQRKLQETADDWATPVSDLSPIVVNFAKK